MKMGENDERMEPANAGGSVSPDQAKELKPDDYLRAMKAHLTRNDRRGAYSILQAAAVMYPDDPFILSYYGSLQAIVDKKYRSGIDNCRRAILLFKKKALDGEFWLYTAFYLNLGRACLAAGKKKDAIDAFEKGLQSDNDNSAILKELQGLGMRARPRVTFLDRSNPINKFLGKMLN